MHLLPSIAIQSNLELKTRPKQLLAYLPLDIEFPVLRVEQQKSKMELKAKFLGTISLIHTVLD
jgi:hypothetical protein